MAYFLKKDVCKMYENENTQNSSQLEIQTKPIIPKKRKIIHPHRQIRPQQLTAPKTSISPIRADISGSPEMPESALCLSSQNPPPVAHICSHESPIPFVPSHYPRPLEPPMNLSSPSNLSLLPPPSINPMVQREMMAYYEQPQFAHHGRFQSWGNYTMEENQPICLVKKPPLILNNSGNSEEAGLIDFSNSSRDTENYDSEKEAQRRSSGCSDNTEHPRLGKRRHSTLIKDEKYWGNRKKNNEAAKRSRDAKRKREDERARRLAELEKVNEEQQKLINRLRMELLMAGHPSHYSGPLL